MSERNIAAKDAASWMVSDGSDYSAPLQGDDDLLARGLINYDGTATDKGVLFTQLQDEGIFDGRGALTDKGKAYAMPYGDALKPENLAAYQIRSQDQIDRRDDGKPGVAESIGDFVWDAGAGALHAVKNTFFDFGRDRDKIEAEKAAGAVGMIEGAVNNAKEMAALGKLGLAHVGSAMDHVVFSGETGNNMVWEARQARDRMAYEHQQAKEGEVFGDLLGVADAAQTMAEVKDQLGPEEFAKITKQARTTGAVVGDPTNVIIPAAMGAKAVAKAGLVSRMALKAEQVADHIATLDMKLANVGVEQAAAQAAKQTAEAAAVASRAAHEGLLAKFEEVGSQAIGDEVKNLAERAGHYETQAAKWGSDLEAANAKASALAEQRAALAGATEEAAARTNRFIEIAKQAKSLPAQAVGSVVERLGTALSKLTDTSEIANLSGISRALQVVKPLASAAGFQMGGIPGAAAAWAALGSGDAIAGWGKFGRVVGKELMQARGQIPFWQRVANYAELSPIQRGMAHLMDTATLGGAVPGAARRVAGGTLAAYPVDLLVEYLQDDGASPGDIFSRALQKDLILGGSSAALGGMFLGSKERHKQLALGDQRNFLADLRSKGDLAQVDRFQAVPQGVQRAIATYAAANPRLNWEFAVDGHSHFDRNTNTVRVNIAGDTPLKALVAHEINHNLLVRNQMEDGVIATMIGDGEQGGLLRSRDGKLDPSFESFLDEYNQRLKERGEQPVSVREGALEYFVDAAADRMSNMAESGALGKAAGRTEVSRVLGRAIDTLLPKVPILRDLHMKMGGLFEPDTGRVVVGNGLVADGLREHPEARRLFKQMMDRSAGRAEGSFNALGKAARREGGVPLPVGPNDHALKDIQSVSIHEMNPDGTFRLDANGNRMPISSATDLARAKVGLELRRIHDEMLANGYKFKEGEIHIGPDGNWTKGHMAEPMIVAMGKSEIYNPSQMRMTKLINSTIKNAPGTPMVTIYQPALETVGRRKVYKPRPMTLNDTVPLRMTVTKSGNLLTEMLDVKQLHRNLEKRAGSGPGKRLYNGDKEAILNDVQAAMDLHSKGQKTDAYYAEKYGAEALAHKRFINSISGVMTESQKLHNPELASLTDRGNEQVMRSYRNDRINQATKRVGDTAIKLPFQYESWKLNLLPNGQPIRP